MRPAVFFDRDGTLNEEVGYAGHPDQFHIFEWAAPAVRQINDAGWAAVLVTNQAGVARGFYSEAEVAILHRILGQHLEAAGAHLDGVYYCPHHPRGSVADYTRICECRKPEPGMLHQAARDLELDLATSWVVGDRSADIALAHAVGARAILVRTGYGERTLVEEPDPAPDFIATDALAAALLALGQTVRS